MSSRGSNEVTVAETTIVLEQLSVENGEEVNQPIPQQAIAIPAGQADLILAQQGVLKTLLTDGLKEIKTQIEGLILSNTALAANQDRKMKTLLSDSLEQKEMLLKIAAALQDK